MGGKLNWNFMVSSCTEAQRNGQKKEKSLNLCFCDQLKSHCVDRHPKPREKIEVRLAIVALKLTLYSTLRYQM